MMRPNQSKVNKADVLTTSASWTDDDVSVQFLNHIDSAVCSGLAAALYLNVLHAVADPPSSIDVSVSKLYHSLQLEFVIFAARCYAKRGYATVSRLSVCLSLRPL